MGPQILKIVFHAVAARKGKEGGATLLIAETARALVRAAPEHEYVFCLDSGLDMELPAEVRRVDAHVRNPYERVRWDQVTYPRILLEEGADLRVAFLGFGTLRSRIPSVVMLPDSTYFSRYASFGRTRLELAEVALRRQLLRRQAGMARAVVVPSRAMADGLISYFGGKIPIELLRYGWNSQKREPSAKPWDHPIRLLYVSQLQPHKAHINLVEMARSLDNLDLDFQITLCINPADEPRLHAELREAIRLRGLRRRFEILSSVPRSRISELLEESDCFVYPSLCESFGFPMVEAASAGLPIVAAGTAINREMLGSGALYFPPNDPQIGAEKIEWFAEHGLERAEMVERVQDHQSRILTNWDEYGARLVEILERAAGQ